MLQPANSAESLGLEVHGSVGVLLWGAATGHIPNRDEAVRLLEALAAFIALGFQPRYQPCAQDN